MEKIRKYRGKTEVDRDVITSLVSQNLEEILGSSFDQKANYDVDWNYYDEYGSVSIEKYILETDEEFEERKKLEKERKKKDKEAKDKLKLKKEEEERRQYEKLKAKFEK